MIDKLHRTDIPKPLMATIRSILPRVHKVGFVEVHTRHSSGIAIHLSPASRYYESANRFGMIMRRTRTCSWRCDGNGSGGGLAKGRRQRIHEIVSHSRLRGLTRPGVHFYLLLSFSLSLSLSLSLFHLMPSRFLIVLRLLQLRYPFSSLSLSNTPFDVGEALAVIFPILRFDFRRYCCRLARFFYSVG